MTPSVWRSLCAWGTITVGVDHAGIPWDFLAEFDLGPRRVSGGYVCRLRAPEARTVYPTRTALWIGRGFEPLVAWAVRLQARWDVALFRTEDGGATWACLRPPSPDATGRGPIAVYPLLV